MENSTPNKIGALILAAGESSRIGKPKALLTLTNKTFIELIIAQFNSVVLNKIVVITNHNLYPKIRGLITASDAPVEIVINPFPQSTRLQSIKLGLAALIDHNVFIHNVDNPFVATEYLPKMIDLLKPECYVSLRYQSKGGHPVLLSHNIVNRLADIDNIILSLRQALLHCQRVSIDTNDSKILTNINTINDYNYIINN